jgi:hypothetical protein
MSKILLTLGLITVASTAFSGDIYKDKVVADIYGNTDKTVCYWKHQPQWDKQHNPMTYYERESCNHHLAYPYAYKSPPSQQ